VDDWAKERHHVIMNGDVKPDQIVGIHEPWHAHARYIRDNGGHKEYSWLEDPKQNWGLDQEVKAYHYLKGQEGKTAKVREAPDDGEQHTGIMVAIVPPASVVESLVLEEGESANELHVTMAYLGNTDEYSEALLGNLHEVVEAWAEDQAKFTALVQGVGTFLPASEDEQHVLWASIGSPRLHRLQASLVDHLKGHGYDPRENHGFCAHVTLAYGKHHFRFMPKVKRQTFKVHEVWVVVAGRWESIPLGRPEHKKISA
jgi:2'-5' RNA ligase